jgi:type I restriction enzyme S subunit
MRRVKLGQICEVVSGGTPKTNVEEYWNGEFNWITPAEINDNDYIISDTKRKITQLAIEKKKLPLLPKGTVLLSSRAPIGKVAITGKEMYCNQGFKNLICSDEICNEYLYWYLKSKKEYLNSLGRGATFKEISKKIVENIEIKLPEIERQRKIVDKLKKVDKIIQRRKNQSRLLDVVVQARFVEMFGDPIINNMSWSESTIGDGCFVTKLAGFEYSKYIEYDDTGDVVMVKAQNVKNGTLNRKDLSFISNEVSDALPRSQLLPGDVVMTYVGANIGDVALIDDKYKYHLAPNVAKIRVDAKIYNSVYFMYMLMFLNSYIVKNSADTAKAALGMERIRKLKVFIPTYDLQNQFAAFVQQVNKSKFVIHKFLYCTTHNTQSIIKPRPNTKESGKTRGGKPYADEF